MARSGSRCDTGHGTARTRTTEPHHNPGGLDWDPQALASELSELVASRLTFRDAVPALLSTLVATVGWPVAVLWMVDPTRGRLRCTEVVTARSGMAKRFERRCRTVSFKEGDGIPGRAWRSRVPVLVDRHVDDRRWDDAADDDDLPDERIDCGVAFPLVTEGRVLGVVEILAGDQRPLTAPLQRALAQLGTRLGAVLDRYLAMEAAGTERARLESALAAGRMGVWDWDVEADRVRWSAALEDMTGLDPGGFDGSVDGFIGSIHDDDREWVLEQFLTAMDPEGTHVLDIEYRIQMPEGDVRWLHVAGRSVVDVTGRVVAMTGVAVDVTDRVTREEDARMGAAQLDVVLDVTGMGAWRWYHGSNTGWWSRSLVEIAGRGPVGGGTVSTDDIVESVHPDDVGVFEKLTAAARDQRDFHDTYRIVRPDGAVQWMEAWGRPLYDGAGALIGIAGVAVPIDEPGADTAPG